MKESSVIVCPICGGPTHLSRDTGDFTCDHCGKIIVRAMKNNNWVPSLFDTPVLSSFEVESIEKSQTNKLVKVLKRHPDITYNGINGSGHHSFTLTRNDNVINFVFPRIDGDPHALKNKCQGIYKLLIENPKLDDDGSPMPEDKKTIDALGKTKQYTKFLQNNNPGDNSDDDMDDDE